jgi:predicted RNA-binding Zn-ribbon protein involved in translation (DUF1610 family)
MSNEITKRDTIIDARVIPENHGLVPQHTDIVVPTKHEMPAGHDSIVIEVVPGEGKPATCLNCAWTGWAAEDDQANYLCPNCGEEVITASVDALNPGKTVVPTPLSDAYRRQVQSSAAKAIEQEKDE